MLKPWKNFTAALRAKELLGRGTVFSVSKAKALFQSSEDDLNLLIQEIEAYLNN
jgi:hypothetical protein